jgi:heme/copper-type cytochrome/quinol oxidase subunit 4
MKKTIITLSLLVLLTIISAIVSALEINNIAFTIILLAGLKFIGVSFYFMDLKQAHTFWKGSIIFFLTLIFTTILIII